MKNHKTEMLSTRLWATVLVCAAVVAGFGAVMEQQAELKELQRTRATQGFTQEITE